MFDTLIPMLLAEGWKLALIAVVALSLPKIIIAMKNRNRI